MAKSEHVHGGEHHGRLKRNAARVVAIADLAVGVEALPCDLRREPPAPGSCAL